MSNRGRKSRFTKQTKTSPIRVPDGLKDYALEFAELLDSIGGQGDLRVEYKLIKSEHFPEHFQENVQEKVLKQGAYIGVTGGYVTAAHPAQQEEGPERSEGEKERSAVAATAASTALTTIPTTDPVTDPATAELEAEPEIAQIAQFDTPDTPAQQEEGPERSAVAATAASTALTTIPTTDPVTDPATAELEIAQYTSYIAQYTSYISSSPSKQSFSAEEINDFAEKIFKHWRAIAIEKRPNHYWGQRVKLDEIYKAGFKEMTGNLFLRMIEEIQGVKISCGCQAKLYFISTNAIGESTIRQECESISFVFPDIPNTQVDHRARRKPEEETRARGESLFPERQRSPEKPKPKPKEKSKTGSGEKDGVFKKLRKLWETFL